MHRRIHGFFMASACLILLTACSAVTPTPGADKVKVTKTAADVAGCTAVGNIQVPRNADGLLPIGDAGTEFRNRIVGLGGNAGLVTSGILSVPAEGIAYRCP